MLGMLIVIAAIIILLSTGCEISFPQNCTVAPNTSNCTVIQNITVVDQNITYMNCTYNQTPKTVHNITMSECTSNGSIDYTVTFYYSDGPGFYYNEWLMPCECSSKVTGWE